MTCLNVWSLSASAGGAEYLCGHADFSFVAKLKWFLGRVNKTQQVKQLSQVQQTPFCS